jgi:hypothetical protein
MKAGNKYKAKDILFEAGFTKEPEDYFGNYLIVIEGITGIVDPEQEIYISENEDSYINVTVGRTIKQLEFA